MHNPDQKKKISCQSPLLKWSPPSCYPPPFWGKFPIPPFFGFSEGAIPPLRKGGFELCIVYTWIEQIFVDIGICPILSMNYVKFILSPWFFCKFSQFFKCFSRLCPKMIVLIPRKNCMDALWTMRILVTISADLESFFTKNSRSALIDLESFFTKNF